MRRSQIKAGGVSNGATAQVALRGLLSAACAVPFLVGLELLHGWLGPGLPEFSLISWGQFVAGLVTFAGLVFLGNGLPVWGLGLLGLRLERRCLPFFWGAAAAVFGYFWQETVVHGDGISAHEHYRFIRITLAIAVPWVLGFYVGGFVVWEELPGWIRRVGAAMIVAGGSFFAVFILADYRTFHGFLAMFLAALVAWLIAPLMHRRWARLGGGVVLACLMVVGGLVAPSWVPVQLHVQGYSHLPAGMLQTMPLTAWLEMDPEDLAEPGLLEADFGAAQEAGERFAAGSRGDFARQRGSNVLMIMLESVRWDVWENPEYTPRFQKWRRYGLYLPNAIVQYPATPLAYGSLFTSQPPYVLMQSPHWGEHRLFDQLADSFDIYVTSQPKVPWFDNSAITQFFLPEGIKPNKHRTAGQALAHLKKKLRKRQAGKPFFAWVHIYEPHSPYKLHKHFDFGAKKRQKYYSEIAHTDAVLGTFMEWFFKQPYANDTLVIVMGDHGQGLGEKIRGKKFWGHHVHVNNVVSRVPLFVAAQGLPRGEIDAETTVSQLDIMPTLFDYLGVTPLPELYVQGYSIYRLLARPVERSISTEAFGIRGKAFFKFVRHARAAQPGELRETFARIASTGKKYSPKVAIQRGRYKILYDRMLREYWLYDIVADPYEKKDLSQSHPDVLAEMKERLLEWRVEQAWIIEQLKPLIR